MNQLKTCLFFGKIAGVFQGALRAKNSRGIPVDVLARSSSAVFS